jgi:hypothetical protein
MLKRLRWAADMAAPAPTKSKTWATWITVLGGCLGLQRFYLYGFGDRWGWLHPWPSLLGWIGVHRMQTLGQDDKLAWVLIPLLGLMVAGTMLTAIVYGLTPDEKWNARHNAGRSTAASGWCAVLGVVVALLIGGTALMATIAFSAQRYFENQVIEQASGANR